MIHGLFHILVVLNVKNYCNQNASTLVYFYATQVFIEFVLVIAAIFKDFYTCFQVLVLLAPKRSQSRAFARNPLLKLAVVALKPGLVEKSVQNCCRAKSTSAKSLAILGLAHHARKRALRSAFVAQRKKKDPATLLNFSVTR